MTNKLCKYCNQLIGIGVVGCGDGKWAHPYCYEKNQPTRKAENIQDIFSSLMDPVLGRNILVECLSPMIQNDLVSIFNTRYAAQQKRRLAQMKTDHEDDFTKSEVAPSNDLVLMANAIQVAARAGCVPLRPEESEAELRSFPSILSVEGVIQQLKKMGKKQAAENMTAHIAMLDEIKNER